MLGWTELSQGGIQDYEIDAFHKNILKDPNVKSLAEKLKICLKEAMSAQADTHWDEMFLWLEDIF